MTAQPQFAVMEWWLVHQHLEPAGLHRPFLSLAVGANASYFQRVLSEAEFFVSASGAIIGPKRDIQKKYFDPTKTEHRPSANDKECYADAKGAAGCDKHQNAEPRWAKAAVWSQCRSKIYVIIVECFFVRAHYRIYYHPQLTNCLALLAYSGLARTGKVSSLSLMKKADIEEFFRRLEAQRPDPQGELHYVNSYTLLVAVVLSAQATDIGVNRATKRLFEKADTPEKMVALGERNLKNYIKTIGLFNSKAKNVIGLSQILIEEHDSDVPRDRDALQKLPGVGRKTANVVLNIAFGEPTIAVDTHLFRLGNRTGIAPGKTPLAVEKKFLRAVPNHYMRHAHHWLILHGRYVCKARKPDCTVCVVEDLCRFKGKSL